MIIAAVAVATAPAAIRSADGEVGYRVAESLAMRGSFAVPRVIETWPGFGTPVGRDGRRYSLFGPLVPVYLAPAVAVIEGALDHVDPTGIRLPPSHYYGDGFWSAISGAPIPANERRGHLARSIVGLAVIPLLVLAGLIAFELAAAISGSTIVGWLAGLLLPLGTFTLSYATCLFGEIPAMVLTLLGVLAAVRNDPRCVAGATPRHRRAALAGLLVGGAALAHVSSVLALPFVGWYAAFPGGHPDRSGFRRLLAFSAAAAIPLALQGTYNAVHFGSVFETGRGLQTGFGYGRFVAPWEGLLGLTVSYGKGLLWYSPLALLTLIPLVRAMRIHRPLALMAISAFVVRVVFIACRSDWHGGFGLGPRYLLLGLPFALVPAIVAAREGGIEALLATGRRRSLALLGLAALIAQQLYFASGEVFTLQFLNLQRAIAANVPNLLYFRWEWSPLAGLVPQTTGPILFHWMGLGSAVGWVLLTVVVCPAVAMVTRRVFARRTLSLVDVPPGAGAVPDHDHLEPQARAA